MGNISAGSDFKALADSRRLELEGRGADGLASDEKVAEFKKDLEGLPVDVVEGMIATCDNYLPAVHDLIYEGFDYKPEYRSPWAE